MRPLSAIRAGWKAAEKENIRILRATTVQETVREYLLLRAEFEPWLRLQDAREEEERLTRLTELSNRLSALDRSKGDRVDDLIDALIVMQERLDRAGIPSVLIGGLAVGVWGRARLTRDVDMKVLLSRDSRQTLLDLIEQHQYKPLHADPDAALRFNGILFVHDPGNVRIDLALADTKFDEVAIRRGQMIELRGDKQARVCTAEDLLVLKLISTREQDAVDAAGIIARQRDALENDYVLDWLRQFEIALDDSTFVHTYEQLRQEHKS